MKKHILVIDDDGAMREMMALALSKEGFQVKSAGSAADGIAALKKGTFDLVVSDIYLGDGTGLDLVDTVRNTQSEARVILVTARGTIETAAFARDHEVFDYLAKPFELEHLVDRVRAALVSTSIETAVQTDDAPRSMIIGSDPAIVEVYKSVARVAPMDVPVLILGETGTGKELVATALHRFGSNPEGPFVPINCGAIPENLLESELFGHRRGSFTGADSDRPGAVQAARNGTLFLDEVGELPLALQVKLLRFLQSGEIHPVGAKEPIHVPVRVVAATHRNLRVEARDGAFREDVYYRIAAYEIILPPLRDRSSDIPLLVDHFLRMYEENEVRVADEEVLKLLIRQPWPGNVRQLEHVIRRALIDSGGLTEPGAVAAILNAMEEPSEATEKPPAIGDDLTLTELERRHIEAVLERCGGNRTRASEILGIERKSLYRKMHRLGIAPDSEDQP